MIWKTRCRARVGWSYCGRFQVRTFKLVSRDFFYVFRITDNLTTINDGGYELDGQIFMNFVSDRSDWGWAIFQFQLSISFFSYLIFTLWLTPVSTILNVHGTYVSFHCEFYQWKLSVTTMHHLYSATYIYLKIVIIRTTRRRRQNSGRT